MRTQVTSIPNESATRAAHASEHPVVRVAAQAPQPLHDLMPRSTGMAMRPAPPAVVGRPVSVVVGRPAPVAVAVAVRAGPSGRARRLGVGVGRPPSSSSSGRVPGSGASAMPPWSRSRAGVSIRDIPDSGRGRSGSDQGGAGFPAATCRFMLASWTPHPPSTRPPARATGPARAPPDPPRKLPPPSPAAHEPRLHRAGRGRMLAGVAAGLADYFDVDPTLVRIAFVALAFLGGLAVPLYAGRLAAHPRRGDRHLRGRGAPGP